MRSPWLLILSLISFFPFIRPGEAVQRTPLSYDWNSLALFWFWRLSWWKVISLGFYHYARETSPCSCPGVPPLPCQRPGSVWFKGRPTFSLQSTAWTSKLLPSTQSEFLFIFNYFYLLQSWSSLSLLWREPSNVKIDLIKMISWFSERHRRVRSHVVRNNIVKWFTFCFFL